MMHTKELEKKYTVRFLWSQAYLSPLVGLTMAIVAIASSILLAQGSDSTLFPYQQRVPDYTSTARPPHLITDQYGIVHAFTSDTVGDDNAIEAVVYRQWSKDVGWTEPIDVLLSPRGQQAEIQDVLLDGSGMFHLIYFGGNAERGDIYYAQSQVGNAAGAPYWSEPQIVGLRAASPRTAQIVAASDQRLHIIFGGDLEGNGLYVSESIDNGVTWSDPSPIFLTYDPDQWPVDLDTLVDSQGRIHLAWAVHDASGNARSIHYTRLETGQPALREPFEVENLGGVVSGAPVLHEYDGELWIIYHAPDEDGLTRFMRRSEDGGSTWSQSIRLFPQVGSNGPPSLVVDSNDAVHMLFGNRVTMHNEILQAMWHSRWQNGRWSEPQAIVSGRRVADSRGGSGFDPSFAHAAISRGNTLLVTWMTDPGAGRNGVWYAVQSVDAPELPSVPLPERAVSFPIPTPEIVPIAIYEVAAMNPSVEKTSLSVYAESDGKKVSSSKMTPVQSPAVPVAVGLFPVLLVSALAITLSRLRH